MGRRHKTSQARLEYLRAKIAELKANDTESARRSLMRLSKEAEKVAANIETGRKSQETGKARENLVVSALQEDGYKYVPEWLKFARLATHNEDSKGIDIVVDSDVGKIYLQVKGSSAHQIQFEASHKRKVEIMPVIIVDLREIVSEVRSNALNLITPLRQRFLEKRGKTL